MKTLASLLSWTISQLQAWPNSREVRTLETEAFAEDQFHFKVRTYLPEPFQLQIRFYYNRGHLDYSYQLFNGDPILRWDNKEDVGPLSTAPHHFHNDKDEIVESPLNGDPSHDWPIVKEAIDQFLDERSKSEQPHNRFSSELPSEDNHL
ncbi:MAG TPA: DUF6516 family protein [Anaerolineales bacterium]|nr:DUF6516 family protein [Anaerolineales bacterium]